MIEALRREINARGLEDDVQVTTCGSLGICEWGPNMIVYPEGVWYAGVTPADVQEIVRSHFEENTPVERLARTDGAEVRAEILANRAKRFAAMRAREAAGALPDDLQERIRAFQESRAILTALELDVFTALGGGATAEEAAARTGTDARAMEMLLHALAALGLASKQAGVFRNTPVTKRYFTAGSPDNAQPALMHTAHLWGRWSTLTDCVRAGTSVASREPPDRGDSWTEAFIAAMHRNASERAGAVVRAVGAAEVRRMLDVGGGSGAYSIAFAKANPDLAADILDLAEVAPIAQGHIEQAGVADRVASVPATFGRTNWAKATTWSSSPPSATCSTKTRTATCWAAVTTRWRRAAASRCRISSWSRTRPRRNRPPCSRSTCWWARGPAAPTASRNTPHGWRKPASGISAACGCRDRRAS